MKKNNIIRLISNVKRMLKNSIRVVSVSLFFILSVSTVYSQIREIIIDPSATYQEIENFAASDAWSGNFVGQYWGEKQKGQIAEWLFSQQYDELGNPKGIGLSMWRVNIGAGSLEQDSADIEPFQRRAESFRTKDGKSYDWGKCSGQQYFMSKAVDYGCNSFLLFSNSPLVQYTKNGKGWSSSDNEANIKPDCYSKYTSYMADVAKYFTEEKGWHIRYISPINEPQVNWVTPRQEGSPWRSSEMKKMYVELNRALTESQLDDIKIYVGETASLQGLYGTTSSMKRFPGNDAPDYQIERFFNPKSPDYIGDLEHVAPLIAGHSYHSHKTNKDLKETREKVKLEATKYGISFHQSEWCMLPARPPMDGFTPEWKAGNHAGMQPALLLGRLVYGDLVYAGAKAWGYWKGMELNGDFALISLYPVNSNLFKGGNTRTNKLLWALGNYSFFIRPGYSRIGLNGAEDPDKVIASAYLSPDKSRIVTVYVNSSFEMVPVKISFLNGWGKEVKKVSVFRTDDRTDLAKVYMPEGFLSDREYVIPPRSLVTMVFDL